jgi:hypothetical protein
VGISSVAISVDGGAYTQVTGLASWAFSLDTTLLTDDAHTLTARAVDTSGNQQTTALSVTSDNSPPIISAVASSGITGSGATISWTTSEPADSQVEYGQTAAYGSAGVLAAALVTSHTQALTGLLSQTGYHYRARSDDALGNLAFSDDLQFITVGGLSVSITSPVDGAEVEGTVPVSVSGSSSTALVTRVELWVDGVLSDFHDFTPSVASFTNVALSWKTTAGGSHSLQAKVYDALGLSGTSTVVSVRAAGNPKVTLVDYNGNRQNGVTGEPRALLLSLKPGLQQTLVFSSDIKEASLVDTKGRVIKKVSSQGGGPIVLSLQNTQDSGLGLRSGLLLIQMKDSSGKYSVKPLMVVK